MFRDSLFNELIIDNFAGGGGASVGIELATGSPVDIAINHDADAIAMHSVNHPYTAHYREDVFAINPEEVTGGRPVGIAWFSPDCKHFSRAKGNKPVEHKIRGLSWVILKWAMSSVAPRCIFMENVEEIQTWGPLIYVDGKEISETERVPGSWRPDPAHTGETLEIRKSEPKQLKPPFKAFIYCTQGKGDCLWRWNGVWYDTQDPNHRPNRLDGKVIGEFICDRIIDIPYSRYYVDYYHAMPQQDFEDACLDMGLIDEYLRSKDGFGWHISDLKIYDNPRELSEFSKYGFGHPVPLKRPPQSWMYVEEI